MDLEKMYRDYVNIVGVSNDTVLFISMKGWDNYIRNEKLQCRVAIKGTGAMTYHGIPFIIDLDLPRDIAYFAEENIYERSERERRFSSSYHHPNG